MDKSERKSAVTLLTLPFKNYKDFQMRYCVAQGASKLQDVKVGGPKIIFSCMCPSVGQIKTLDFFSDHKLRTLMVLQPLEPHGCTVSHLKFFTNFEL